MGKRKTHLMKCQDIRNLARYVDAAWQDNSTVLYSTCLSRHDGQRTEAQGALDSRSEV